MLSTVAAAVAPVNKATAAVVAGAVCTILIWLWGSFVTGHPMTPEAQAALQTIITAVCVYFWPKNAPS